ncbi:MAG: tagatose 1,6-diphosphate aldolase [Chloroflexi bacterium]|nr:tagatose 1,6-diphosphate aldolase [Chloroflexota bacterium]
MSGLTIGRARALQASATPNGVFTILAMDHRDALRVMVNPAAPETVSADTLTDLKLAVVQQLAPLASAVLLDPIYGAAQAIVAGALPGHVGLLCALEDQGYLGNPFARQTALLDGWNVEKAKRLGATGVKILLLYHPDSPAAEQQEELVRGVLRECARHEIPLFLEPISYALDSNVVKSSAQFARERRRIVVESVKRLGALKPDVLKVEFAVDVKYETERAVWADACAELDAASPVPWALLSADEPFEVFREQVRVQALENGARTNFLETLATHRFQTLVEIAREYGKPWSARYAMPNVNANWYREF